MRPAATGFALALMSTGLFLVGACSSSEDDDDDFSGTDYYPTGGVTGAAASSGVAASTSVSGGGGSSVAGGSTTIPTGGSTSSTGGSSTSTPAGGSSTSPSVYVEACPGVPVDGGESDTCIDTAYMSEPMPVDLFIMMDRSDSMKTPVVGQSYTRWEGIKAAVDAFVHDPDVIERDIRMGINFFNQTSGFIPDIDCNVANYADPTTMGVEIASVADPAQQDAIMAAIDGVTPGGQTPTMPALQGALQHAKEFNANHGMGRAMVVVLVTDGLPTQCQEPLSVPEIANVAEQAYASEPSVKTFIVGIGPALSNLNQIAAKGGTYEAFLIEEGDAAAQFVDAMKNITLAEISCEFTIPESPSSNEVLNLDMVRLIYQPDVLVEEYEEIPKLQSYAGCFGSSSGGWYYDNPSAPTAVLVCPCTCTRFRTGFVDVQYGCSPLAL